MRESISPTVMPSSLRQSVVRSVPLLLLGGLPLDLHQGFDGLLERQRDAQGLVRGLLGGLLFLVLGLLLRRGTASLR